VTDDELVPLKRVLDEVGVSRATLWRALKSDLEGFPKPTVKRRRVYWRRDEVKDIDNALDAYLGRGAFDQKRRRDQLRPQERHRVLTELRNTQRKRKRRPKDDAAPSAEQRDFFRS
jgi:predicted DNA-binding transcriptional regulator AlpA